MMTLSNRLSFELSFIRRNPLSHKSSICRSKSDFTHHQFEGAVEPRPGDSQSDSNLIRERPIAIHRPVDRLSKNINETLSAPKVSRDDRSAPKRKLRHFNQVNNANWSAPTIMQIQINFWLLLSEIRSLHRILQLEKSENQDYRRFKSQSFSLQGFQWFCPHCPMNPAVWPLPSAMWYENSTVCQLFACGEGMA
jgi:hypothetical protein